MASGPKWLVSPFRSAAGVDFKTKIVPVGSKRYKLQLWDTAGQERYNTIRKGFYRGAKVIAGEGGGGGEEEVTSRYSEYCVTAAHAISSRLQGIVLVYDITTLESFKSLKKWVNDITEVRAVA